MYMYLQNGVPLCIYVFLFVFVKYLDLTVTLANGYKFIEYFSWEDIIVHLGQTNWKHTVPVIGSVYKRLYPIEFQSIVQAIFVKHNLQYMSPLNNLLIYVLCQDTTLNFTKTLQYRIYCHCSINVTRTSKQCVVQLWYCMSVR